MSSKLKTVMIIEDDSVTSFLVQRILKKIDAFEKILIYESAQPALDYLDRSILSNAPCPDLIILDILLPGMDGDDFFYIISKYVLCKFKQ